ncbi:VC0807 family protein [Paenibacillus humicola]|uniref:VC0807 family protein n=1 Tax=Paenibacillus humicola TaxID=3110540 RepID=UPI00237AD891|nr:VC0807 family protein [Paenibacillus humicola]
MFVQAESRPRSRDVRKRQVPSLAVNWIAPFIVYHLLSGHFVADTYPLAIAGCIPVVWVIIMMAKSRKADWIGIIGIAGFAVSLAVSLLSGGGSLPIKLAHPLITGAAGLLFLISSAVGKPLLIPMLRASKQGDPRRLDQPEVYRRISSKNVWLGAVLAADAAINVGMALTLPTSTFMVASQIVSLALVAFIFLILRRRTRSR